VSVPKQGKKSAIKQKCCTLIVYKLNSYLNQWYTHTKNYHITCISKNKIPMHRQLTSMNISSTKYVRSLRKWLNWRSWFSKCLCFL